MAKKSKKSSKKVHRRIARKAWYERLFTFTNIVVISIVLLSVFTLYQVIKPSKAVEGASTVSLNR